MADTRFTMSTEPFFSSGKKLKQKRFVRNSEWYKDRKETQRRFEAGEISDVERGLSNVAGTVRAALTPVDLAMEAAASTLPEGLLSTIMEPVSAVGRKIADTGMYQQAAQLARDNPRAVDVIEDFATVGGVAPIGRIATGAANQGAMRVPTMLEGFYGFNVGGPQKAAAAARGVAKALPQTITDAFNPRAIATERATGVPLAKAKGETGAGKRGPGEESFGSALTVANISRQSGKGPAKFIEEGPIGVTDRITSLPATNTAAIKNQLFQKGVNISYDVPEVVKNRAMAHLYDPKVWGFKPNQTEMVIKRPGGVQQITNEAKVGQKKGAIPLKMLAQKQVKVGETKGKKEIKTDGFPEFLRKSKKKSLQDANSSDLLQYYASKGIKAEKGSKGDPHIYVKASHNSESKELGGVNDFIAINADSGDVFVMISDRHDMFGMDPVGGSSLVTAVPMQRSNFKGGATKFKTGDNLKSTMTEIEPEVNAAAERLEKLSGIKRQEGETPVSYNLRVIKEYREPVKAKDVGTAARRAGMLGAVGTTAALSDEEAL